AGNTYTEAGAARSVDSGAGSVADLWYVKSSVAGATTVTVTPSSTVIGGSAVIWEFSGMDVSTPLDQTAILNNQGPSATPIGASVTTIAADEVVFSIATGATVSGIKAGNQFIADSTVGGGAWSHDQVSSTGTYSAQWSQSSATTYASSTASFRAAGKVTLSSNN